MEENVKKFSGMSDIEKKKIIKVVIMGLMQAKTKAEEQVKNEAENQAKTKAEEQVKNEVESQVKAETEEQVKSDAEISYRNSREKAEIYNKIYDAKNAISKSIYNLYMQVKKGPVGKAITSMAFADFFGDFFIENIDKYSNMPLKKIEKLVLEEMRDEDILRPEIPLPIIEDKYFEEQAVDLQSSSKISEEQAVNSKLSSAEIVKNLERKIDARKQYLKRTPSIIQQSLEEEQKVVDLSKLNNPELLLTSRRKGRKEIKYGRYSDEKQKTLTFNYQGKKAQITRTGRLGYKTPFMLEADIDEYKLKTIEGQNTVYTYGLNIDKLTNDEEYKRIFFERLISYKNIYWINKNGYIGDIVEDEESPNKYKIEYSAERYTAVEELKNRLEKLSRRRVSGDKDDRE